MASIFHANPTSITSLPAQLCAPRGQVFRENTPQAPTCSTTPVGVLTGNCKVYFLVLETESRASCLLSRHSTAGTWGSWFGNRVGHKRGPDLPKVGH